MKLQLYLEISCSTRTGNFNAALFNQTIAAGVLPQQWKTAVITQVLRVPAPTTESDYYTIYITPVLSRLIEGHIVTTFLYPALHNPPSDLTFSDQYAFRPTGSTTAALISLQHTICPMVSTNSFALDFSRAFDSSRHHKLLDNMSSLRIPDERFNRMDNFSASVHTVQDSARKFLNSYHFRHRRARIQPRTSRVCRHCVRHVTWIHWQHHHQVR